MTASEVFSEIGGLIEQCYKPLKFRYSKSKKWAKAKQNQFEFMISFSSFSGNKKDDISLSVDLIVYDNRIDNQILFISLWNNGHYYQINQSNTVKQVFQELAAQIDILLIPFVKGLENVSEHENEWVNHGFLGNIEGAPFKTNIIFINEYYSREAAERCFNNYYNSLNPKAKTAFKKVYECEQNRRPLTIDLPSELDEDYFVYLIIEDAVKLGLSLR